MLVFSISQRVAGFSRSAKQQEILDVTARQSGHCCEFCGYESLKNTAIFRDNNPLNTAPENLSVVDPLCQAAATRYRYCRSRRNDLPAGVTARRCQSPAAGHCPSTEFRRRRLPPGRQGLAGLADVARQTGTTGLGNNTSTGIRRCT